MVMLDDKVTLDKASDDALRIALSQAKATSLYLRALRKRKERDINNIRHAIEKRTSSKEKYDQKKQARFSAMKEHVESYVAHYITTSEEYDDFFSDLYETCFGES